MRARDAAYCSWTRPMSAWFAAAAIVGIALAVSAAPHNLDVTDAEVVVVAGAASPRVHGIVDFLLIDGARSRLHWLLRTLDTTATAAAPAHALIVVHDNLTHVLATVDGDVCAGDRAASDAVGHVEGGFVAVATSAAARQGVLSLLDRDVAVRYDASTTTMILVSGATEAGVRAAIGELLRRTVSTRATGSVSVSSTLCVVHAPPPWFHMRGHQMTDWGYTFLSWDTAQEYVRDLATFGTNLVEFAHIVRGTA